MSKSNTYLILAIFLALLVHGSAIFFTLENTYDALIHLFFAEHYSAQWFEPWNYKWYTGFTVTSYPPLVHQSMALFSFIGGLKFGLFVMALLSIVLFVSGIYRFSLLMSSNKEIAGYAALIAVFSSSFIETIHIFGQLPTIIGVALLLHTLPYIYRWLRTGDKRDLVFSLALIAVTVASHHVTPIFGMIFFIFPLIGMAIMDAAKEQVGSFNEITLRVFINRFRFLLLRIVSFGFFSLIVMILTILPYWINSKTNPITQVPIPHGSRDHFIEIGSSGLVFFVIPWGAILLVLPYIFYRYFSRRYLFFGLSIALLSLLGTGGTTPLPRMILGETAFNILTLDRFTLWASIMSLPLLGELAYRLIKSDLKELLKRKIGILGYQLTTGFLAVSFLFMSLFTVTLGYFRPMQPKKIDVIPLVNFLNQDEHSKWRYLTLGFGDQMAWLSANTDALTVDGNYHSARRLPELTTRAIERLENSKFKGIEGIGSLQQFLTNPEKYHLKYIFSNDKFYDPILYFCGWQRLRHLENGIMVWEKLNVPPMPSILPKEEIASWQKMMWGLIPIGTVIILVIVIGFRYFKSSKHREYEVIAAPNPLSNFNVKKLKLMAVWAGLVLVITALASYQIYLKNDDHHSPENAVLAYYDAIDYKDFSRAHQLIDPERDIPIDQFMLEVAVTDGLLSSYAKLEALNSETISKSAMEAELRVRSEWITPLEKKELISYKSLIKRQGKWYLLPSNKNHDLPPDQLLSSNNTTFYNHGRRRVTTEKTFHEDVLKQPTLEILNAKLVSFNDDYAIVGTIQNVDNVPADVVLKGILYSESDIELASYNAKFQVKHKLLPKEISNFRIDFEAIAWSNVNDSVSKTFNPNEFTKISLSDLPKKFSVQAAGNVSGHDLYKKGSIHELEVFDDRIEGSLFNSGIREITIPQLLIGHYDANQELLWVDHNFLDQGVRQQRKQAFRYDLDDITTLEIINDDISNCMVNGLPNGAISSKMVPNRRSNLDMIGLQPLKNGRTQFIKIELNNYVAN